ncbi:MAG: BASS family bile acid:Na+ symporter [Myxococcota bacterium]
MTAKDIVEIYIPVTIGVIMLTMGLGLRLADFKRIVSQPRAMLFGVFGQLIMLPAVGFGLAIAFSLPPEMAVGLVLLTACPGGPSSNLYSSLAYGDTALSVSLTAISGVVTIFTIPLIVNLALDVFMGSARSVQMPVVETMLKIVLIVGVPLALGMLIRGQRPGLADRIERPLKRVAVVMLAVLVVGAIAKEGKLVGEYFMILGLPILLLSLGTMAFGYFGSRVGRLPARQAITITIEIGMQNGALAIGLATQTLGNDAMAMPGAIYGIIAYFTCAVPLFIGRRILTPVVIGSDAEAVASAGA